MFKMSKLKRKKNKIAQLTPLLLYKVRQRRAVKRMNVIKVNTHTPHNVVGLDSKQAFLFLHFQCKNYSFHCSLRSKIKDNYLVKTAKNTNICSVLHFKNWLQAPLVTCKHKQEATPTWVSFWQLPDNWDTRGAILTTLPEFDGFNLKAVN